ncbi:MAG: FHA domain-containing protein [Bdellovibrionaceae bacterium]|nr:FHA domain-containing protein [Pseudobdellovibrionaceae bacterium]
MSKAKSACLIRVTSAAGTAATCIEAEQFTVGRLGADFLVQDKGVSRIHLTVTIKGQDIWLQDMGSANGTYVGGQKLPQGTPAPYKPGTAVQLGVSRDVVTFEIVESAMTQKAADAAQRDLEHHPSRSLSVQPPTADLAKQADEFMREARTAAAQFKESASREAEAMLNVARQKASELLAKANADIDAMMEQARNNASQATLDREAAAEKALADARRESQEIRNTADDDAERISREARAQSSQLKLTAQREAEELLRNARMTAAAVKDQADLEARGILKEAREKNRAAIERNEQDMERALAEARAAAEKIRSEADDLLEKARTYMHEKGAQVIKEAEEQAATIRSEAMADAGRVRDEARAEGLKTIESGLREAEAEIARVKSEAQGRIDELFEAQKRQEFEIAEIEKRKQTLIQETEERLRDFEATQKSLQDARELLDDMTGQAERARADMTLAQTMRENAVKERDAAILTQRQAEAETAKLKKDVHDGRAALAAELKEMREKGLLDFENRKKAEEAEMAGMKLKWLEDMKARQLEEERQARILKSHQVVEMTRHLEMMLVPKIQSLLGEKESTLVLGELKQELEPMMKRVVLEEQGATGTSEIEQVISADPVIEKFKRRERLRARMTIAVPTMLFIASVVLPEYFEVIRNPGALLRGGKTVEQVIADRRARDLAGKKRFNPVMVNELGNTYSDSVLYTKDYISMKKNKANLKKWALELEKYMYNELGLPENVATSYVAAEMTMIDNLIVQRAAIDPDYEREHIAKVRAIEDEALPELKGKIGGDVAYEKIRAFERKFFDNLRASGSSQN